MLTMVKYRNNRAGLIVLPRSGVSRSNQPVIVGAGAEFEFDEKNPSIIVWLEAGEIAEVEVGEKPRKARG